MKVFCPNCEKEMECNLPIEVYTCTECNEDFADYGNPLTTKLQSENARLREALGKYAERYNWMCSYDRNGKLTKCQDVYNNKFSPQIDGWEDAENALKGGEG